MLTQKEQILQKIQEIKASFKSFDELFIVGNINGEHITRKPYRDTGNIKDKSTKLIHTALYNQFIDENNKKIDSLKSAIKELEDNNCIQKERIEFIQREEEWSHNKSEVLKNDPKLMEKVTKFEGIPDRLSFK